METATAGRPSPGHTVVGQVAGELWGWMLLRGLLALALGAVAIYYPSSTIFAFTLVFASFAFADGVVSLIAGLRGGIVGESRGGLFFRGILGVAVGVLFVLMPSLAATSYAYLTVGVLAGWSVLAGLLEIYAAIRLRRVIQGELLLGLSGLISVALGCAIVLKIMPDQAATILSASWIISIYAFAAGIVLVAHAFRLKSLAR